MPTLSAHSFFERLFRAMKSYTTIPLILVLTMCFTPVEFCCGDETQIITASRTCQWIMVNLRKACAKFQLGVYHSATEGRGHGRQVTGALSAGTAAAPAPATARGQHEGRHIHLLPIPDRDRRARAQCGDTAPSGAGLRGTSARPHGGGRVPG